MGLWQLIVRFFWFLLVLLGIRLLVRAFSRRSAPPRRPPPSPGSPKLAGEMARDPCCGTFVDRQVAWAARVNGREELFCSEECRRKYLSALQGP